MSVRTRLILAYIALAVIPMTVIVMSTYASSLAAYRRAVEAESQAEAEGLRVRMENTRRQLDHALNRASREQFALFPDTVGAEADGAREPRTRPMARFDPEVAGLGDMVESYAFVPLAPAPGTRRPPRRHPPAAGMPAPVEGAGAGDNDAVVFIFETDIGSDETGEDSAISVRIEAPAAPVEAALRAFSRHSRQILHEIEKEADISGLSALAELANIELEDLTGNLELAENTHLRLQRISAADERERMRETANIIGQQFRYEVTRGEEVVGHIHARVRAQQMLRSVLGRVRRDEGEIPFAVDREGTIHAISPEDEAILSTLPISAGDGPSNAETDDGWLIFQSTDPVSGLSFGVARPVAERLEQLRGTAARNLAWGLILVAAAGLCVVPLSSRLTRRLESLTDAAQTLASGDLSVRVTDRSKDEIGHLARAFNHMATELGEHQDQLIEGERQRQEQEIRHRLLTADHERKSLELEAARQFQLSLLPSTLPDHPNLSIAVSMRTATEVGGDFYDFRVADDGTLIATVGDATGHGAVAGTMVTVAKSLFSLDADSAPVDFLNAASSAIRGMCLDRMCMAMLLARFEQGTMRFSSAGMPPPLVWRSKGGELEEHLLPGTPLGAPRLGGYIERTLPLAAGDIVLFLTDGAAEQSNAAGDPLGYERLRERFTNIAGSSSPAEIIADLELCTDQWRGDGPLSDDITFVVLRVE